MSRVKKTITLEIKVFEALEKLRGNRQQFTSQYINDVLKEKLGLTGKATEEQVNTRQFANQHINDVLKGTPERLNTSGEPLPRK